MRSNSLLTIFRVVFVDLLGYRHGGRLCLMGAGPQPVDGVHGHCHLAAAFYET
jgi:hypothetical protein